MSFPPFPSQDLAKLVLGYLVEEQLMTAYDEFLQASPYLDALTNEYDRICMISLKNILAEYRALRIYVESCKPSTLRRKLLQCSNMVEIVKYLVHNVDMNKIYSQEMPTINNSASRDIFKNNSTSKTKMCKLCRSVACVCADEKQQTILYDNNNRESNVEATSLTDLPGNKRSVNVANKDNIIKYSELNVQLLRRCEKENSIGSEERNSPLYNINMPVNLHAPDTHNAPEITSNKNVNDNRVSLEGTFNDFATGVDGNTNSTTIIPDSSTPDNLKNLSQVDTAVSNLHASSLSSSNLTITNVNHKHIRKGPYLLQVTKNVNDSNQNFNADSSSSNGSLKLKADNQKITILSDVKVDNNIVLNKELNHSNMDKHKIPPVLGNSTSSPMLKMQTIYVNGTPAYKSEPQISRKFTFTKDEIMAMPTIILIPTPGPPQNPLNTSYNIETPMETDGLPEINDNMPIDSHESVESQMNDIANKSSLIPYSTAINNINLAKNASLPKDTQVGVVEKMNTPEVQRPTRKSSSTPRRTSHVRVLDFTTPRRILHETISENVVDSNSVSDAIINKSPTSTVLEKNKHTMETIVEETRHKTNIGSDDYVQDEIAAKENNVVIHSVPKKNNWDADLRVLAIVSTPETVSKTHPKKFTKKKKKPPEKHKDDTKDINKIEENKKGSSKKKSSSTKTKNKSHNRKSSENSNDSIVVVTESVDVPVKPTINIITEWKNNPVDNDKISKSAGSLDGTPEMDRNSLHNAIEAKLNISDFLETPYKQALYDIQMETPRFLGPDLLDEPVSDIKIMNIPTPRFFDTPGYAVTPKPAVPTPSSYSSRPTDYSSSGSYYKPDDHDYVPITEDGPIITSSPIENENDPLLSKVTDSVINNKKKSKSSSVKPLRPVRQCTKNISYVNSPLVNKNKGDENATYKNVSSDELDECTNENDKVDDSNKEQTKEKRKRKKTANLIVKSKSPHKKSTPKIRTNHKTKKTSPARDKESAKKCKRKLTEHSSSNILKTQYRRKTGGKDKSVSTTTPNIVPAPTKSRRKSSTPRKLHCTKTFNAESSNHCSENIKGPEIKQCNTHVDSDADNPPLLWSDDGSQDAKVRRSIESTNDTDDLSKIKEFIEETSQKKEDTLVNAKLHIVSDDNGSLHIDLIKRGFDNETAKIIERDLLDSSTEKQPENTIIVPVNTSKEFIIEDNVKMNKSVNFNYSDNVTESTASTSNNTRIGDEEEPEEDLGFSVHESNESSENYFQFTHCENSNSKHNLVTLKDKFCMEIYIEDVTIRWMATPFTMTINEDPKEIIEDNNIPESIEEIDAAVKSISNIEKLYTPIKEKVTDDQAKCIAIFDSTLTSLDTPLKVNTSKSNDETVTEVILEVEQIETPEKEKHNVAKKRKRINSGSVSDESGIENKRNRPEPKYLANIQNFDIESVLSKLHGP